MAKTLQHWLNWQETLHPCEIDLGLQRVDRVIRQLLPECYRSEQPAFPFTIITIAGTNGKGSTVALLEAILCAAGYRVGSYTSPHILHYNERIKINRTAVSDQIICDAFARIDQARGDVSLSYFEFGTLAAIDIMVQQSCDIVLLEVGLGGRLDAVNVIDPDIALVTTVDLDHQDWLGNDRNTIALEKAGIYRQNKPALYGDSDCPDSIKTRVSAQDLSFYQFSVDYHYSLHKDGLWDWGCYTALPEPALKGKVQYQNAANVLMVLDLIKEQFPLTQKDIEYGLQNVRLPGRFQIISRDPFIVLDVAHNEQAVKILKQSLEQSLVFDRLHVIIGMLNDKDCEKVISVLEPLVNSWRVIELDSPRAKPAGEIADIISNKRSHKSVKQQTINIFINFQQAFDDYKKNDLSIAGKDCLLVFGSFYAVTDALQTLGYSKTYE